VDDSLFRTNFFDVMTLRELRVYYDYTAIVNYAHQRPSPHLWQKNEKQPNNRALWIELSLIGSRSFGIVAMGKKE
jgi:hypothetical protein